MTDLRHPWNPLPMKAEGDADSATLFEAVGRALTAWELLEGHLAGVFSGLCGDIFNEGPARAYGVVSGSGSRLDMIEQAYGCFAFRDDARFTGIPKLVDRVRKFAARRNEIAHGIVTLLTSTHGDEEEQSRGHYLCAARYNSRKRVSWATLWERSHAKGELDFDTWLGNYAYTGEQVDYYRAEFESLGGEAMRIIHETMLFRAGRTS